MKDAQIDSVRPSATGAVTLARTRPASRDMAEPLPQPASAAAMSSAMNCLYAALTSRSLLSK
jgi:hypothetical protein